MKKIEVKFPTIEGMKVENARLDLKNGLSIVEYVEDVKFKKGDVVYWMGYNKAFGIVLGTREDDSDQYMLYANGNYTDYDSCYVGNLRLATDSEKSHLLFDALEKEGKYWDSEALEVKEFEGVPESIGIFECNILTLDNKGDELYIGFNDNKQILSTSDGIYTVYLNDSDIYSRINCYLKPISHRDVKVGDTILCGDKEHSTNYFKVIENGCVYTSDENDVYTFGRFGGQDKLFKLIPIK